MFAFCFDFALSALLVILITDLSLGIINNNLIFFLAMPIKSIIALFIADQFACYISPLFECN